VSRKSNHLKNRLKIESERAAKAMRSIADRERRLARERAELDELRKSLNRSVALRMRVQRDFAHPMGDAWALNIVLYPQEFRWQFGCSRDYGMQNASLFAHMRGREVGEKIAQVIERCLTGELKEFEKAV
jgi:exonuclease VII large subunit